MYPHHVFDLEPAGTFGMYPICYQWVSGRYFQPEPAIYSRCFCWFPGPLTPSVSLLRMGVLDWKAPNNRLHQATQAIRHGTAIVLRLLPRIMRLESRVTLGARGPGNQ